MHVRRYIETAAVVVLIALAMTGCRSTCDSVLIGDRGKITLPMWFTTPSGPEQMDVPANVGMDLPEHLRALAAKYELPGWVVYGVVRSLGSDEFLVNGTVRTFAVRDELGESRVVVDNIYYDVDPRRTEAILAGIARDCSEAETELDRRNALGRFVLQRHGGFVLFSVSGATPLKETSGGDYENLLLTSGEGRGAVETFYPEHTEGFPKIGWRETATHYVCAMAGDFRYGDPMRSFRLAEEEAISDLAKGLVLKFSHMSKGYTETQVSKIGDIQEETLRESMTLRMRGVRVTRRVVNLGKSSCVVVVQVAKSGVALR